MSAVETATSTKPRYQGLRQNFLSAVKVGTGKRERLATIWLAEDINEHGKKYELWKEFVENACTGSEGN